MRWKPALGALLFIATIPVAVSELLGPVWSMAVVLIGIGAGWLLVPGFWRSSLHGAIGGVAAGLLVLGPGLRIAMRVVATLDPIRSPEFTVDGTMFIIIGVGVMMGGIFGVIGNVVRGGFGIPTRSAGLVPALLVMLMIGLDGELRTEIVELGAGPWLNIPMFGATALGYGALWTRVVTRLEMRRVEKKIRHETAEDATMTLSNPRGLEI
ncbi:MAG TPA: hypothetical protein VMQ46_02820 [Acidimicrobiia bacterium]|nr:hypothetical protein [Acidimicrobiia bacterium]